MRSEPARSVRPAESLSSPERQRIRPSGGYRELRSFRVSTVIYDATVQFCDRFLDKRSRLIDQMVQAARSGRQNITEGSRASATSSQTELRLINVARASLDELLLDYEDFLRQRKLRQWTKDDPEAQAVRGVGSRAQSDLCDYAPWLGSTSAGTVANCLICLIHQANYLLDHQMRALEQAFIHGGGYTEQLAAARIAERGRQIAPDNSSPLNSAQAGPVPGAPSCPRCGKPMGLRTARKGARSGSQFWGCSQYPSCKGLRKLE